MVMVPMSDSRSGSSPPTAPRAALDALLAGAAGDPIRRAIWLDAVDLRLRPHLPPSLAAHARVANVDGAKLVFLVDSPVWRARLRLAVPVLLASARSIGLEITEVVIKTATAPLQPAPAATKAAIPMSAAAREALQAALASLDEPDKHRS
jgi:hypothetical protein